MRHLIIALAVGTAVLSGCAAQTTQSTTSPQEVTMADLTFANFAVSPGSLTVKAGQAVTILNRDAAGHTVTSDTAGQFETELIGSNQTTSFTAPSEPGTYTFHCEPHPSITGTLIVE